MKKIFITTVFFSIFFAAQLGATNFLEEGPYVEVDENKMINFFMMDVEDFELFLGDRPSLFPCQGKITSKFGWRRRSRRSRRGRLHKGVDIAAPRGTPVVAPATGRVAFVGRKGGYGLTVVLEHGGALSTLFGHNSKTTVTEGQYVVRGQEISKVGNSGQSTGPHLHYEVRVQGVPVNPSRFLSRINAEVLLTSFNIR